jgi:3-oxoadipate enol-lactonase
MVFWIHRSLSGPLIWRRCVSAALVAGGLALAACASPPTRLAAASALPGLGEPKMTITPVGNLASWAVEGAPVNALPLVLWPSIFADHTMYRDILPALRSKYRVVLVDGPGHGASGAPPADGFTMAQCAAALQQVMQAHGLRRAAVGGTSWGGLVGTEFALAYPEATVAVVAMNTPYLMPPEGPGTADRLITFGARHTANTALFAWGVERSFFMPLTRQANEAAMQLFRSHLRSADANALATAVKAVLIDRASMHQQLPSVRAPTLVIAGREDAMYPHEVQARLTATMPAGVFKLVESQHLSAVDIPDVVAGLIDEFLSARPR